MRGFSVCVTALVLAGCAGEPDVVVKWSHPGASYDRFVADRSNCIRSVNKQSQPFFVASVRDPGKGSGLSELIDDVYSDFGWSDPALGGRLDTEMFRRCMNRIGWHVDPKGFAPPDDDAVVMGP